MSSQDAVASYASIILNNYCIVSSTVFFIYDYAVTMDREVASFWDTKFSGAKALFLSNRYLALLDNVLGLIEFRQFTDQSCATYARALTVLTFLQYLPWALFNGLRAYALCKTLILASLIFLLSIIPLPINAARFAFDLTGYNDPVFGCYAADSTPIALGNIFVILARGGLIVSDVVLIGITWWALPRNIFSFRSIQKTRKSLAMILLRNGTIYFGVMLVMNVLHLVFSLSSLFGFADNGASNITAFTENVTAVLISRFLLDLQEANRTSVGSDSSGPLTTSSTVPDGGTLHFARRMADSVGSSIMPGFEYSNSDLSGTLCKSSESAESYGMVTI